ncbi:MAG: universal stress protein [Planctomycetota bacterium]|nr:universal stress protein [Planctomycetota bacterium]
MTSHRSILVAIDASDDALQAVDHVGRAFAGQKDVVIRLLHVVGPMPTELLEHGGAKTAEESARLDAELLAGQASWFAAERERAQGVFQRAEEHLVGLGVDPNCIQTSCVESIPEDDLALLIEAEAEKAGCDTVVVGRHSYSWFGELFHRHIGDALERHATAVEVEVV